MIKVIETNRERRDTFRQRDRETERQRDREMRYIQKGKHRETETVIFD
jgi:hypothetical protein